MDPPRRPRGTARGFSYSNQQYESGDQQMSWPLQQMPEPPPQMSGPRNIALRPQGLRQLALPPISQVEQISNVMKNIHIETPKPIGRGAVCGIRGAEISHYPLIRPESSKLHGKKHEFTANYFPIKSYTNWSLYQYKVDFSPQEDKIGVQRGLLSVHREFLGSYLFDGTMLFSSRKYELERTELISKRNTDDQIVIVTVKFISVIETNDYANIQVFNLLLRNCLRHLNLKIVGRNYFDAEAKIDIPKWKLQHWPGYETTIGMAFMGSNGLLLRTEITTKVMRQDNVLDFFLECINKYRNADYMIKFKSGIMGSVVLTAYNNESYTIYDVDETSNIHSTFQKKDGSKMSYKDYYQTRWNLKIKHGNQPMLVSKKKKSLIKKNDTEDLVYLVPEFCILTGFTEDMRTNFTLMRNLSTYIQAGPEQRVTRYNDFVKRLTSTEKSMEALAQWNLTLGPNLIKVPARVLPQENISYNIKIYTADNQADWTSRVRELPMFLSAKMGSLVILAPQQNIKEVSAFTYSLKKVSDIMHFFLPEPEIIPVNFTNIRPYISFLEEVINLKNPAFILCVVTTRRSDLYNSIKRKLCVDRAVPSQVVLLSNIEKENLLVYTKIAIQINFKIGGAPWRITIPEPGMMIVGFDVCHDKQNKNISYCALIASINSTHTRYFSCVQPHETGQELSSYIATSITLALVKYREKNGNLPTRIVIYRDGVGDGKVGHVQHVEVNRVKSALKNIYKEQESPMAFIIVKKRIGTKIFENINVGNGIGLINPPPGTVIGSVVTNPTMYDFFLFTHSIRFGTITPTYYKVIENTLKNWSPDKMQRLTYKLTYMYYNWSGTIRVPAPCHLAYKLASLCGQSLRDTPNPALNELLYFL